MRILITTLIFIVALGNLIFPQDDENYEASDFYVEEYLETEYKPDYEQVFTSETDRTNFKKLREYLKSKEFIRDKLNRLKQDLAYDKSELEYKMNSINNKIPEIENKIAGKAESEKVYVDVYYPSYGLNLYEDITVKRINNSILPQLREVKNQVAKEDSLTRTKYEKLDKNIKLLESDISLCQTQIDNALAPEYKEQSFRVSISITFAILIGILLLAFFFLIYIKSESHIAIELLSGTGLQFITIFILIISITLFGILGILEGRELAAILSGISGYILGRGIKSVRDSNKKKSEDNTDQVEQEETENN